MLEQMELREADRESAAAPSTRPTVGPRLLVIDDDHLHRMIICRVAAKAGYVPSAAASYDEAAAMVQENTFDCISLDLSLGDHAGVELLRHFWVVGCKVPIIIISGCDDVTCGETAKVAESLKLNIWNSLGKPVNLAVLRDSLERLRAASNEAAADPQQSPQISPA
jgi:DNA-binding NtrC family response regulator